MWATRRAVVLSLHSACFDRRVTQACFAAAVALRVFTAFFAAALRDFVRTAFLAAADRLADLVSFSAITSSFFVTSKFQSFLTHASRSARLMTRVPSRREIEGNVTRRHCQNFKPVPFPQAGQMRPVNELDD